MKKRILFFCLIFFLGIFSYLSFKLLNRPELQKQRLAWETLEKQIKKELDSFNGQAGIIIKDLDRGWQILINQNRLFPSASLVKVPIMAVYFYAVEEGRVGLTETLKLKAAHKSPGSGELKYAPTGTEFTIEKLIELMISESDNTATNMLIKRLGFNYLNDCFKKLKLKDTNISRLMMDFKRRKEGIENFTTASDLANLLEKIYNERLIKKAYSQMCLGFLKKQKIRDRIPKKLPLSTIVAHKTGLESGVCHDAGIIFSPRRDLLIVVLTKHSNKTARLAKSFIAKIALLAYNYY